MSKHQPPWPWSVLFAVQDISAEGQQQHLVADAHARAGVAKLAGLSDVSRLEADLAVVPHGRDGVRITGRVSATAGQRCVVTLDPIQNEIDEPVDVLYLRNPPQSASEAGAADEEPGKVGDERIEALLNDTVDLGAIATEFLILGIDPYPRKREAILAPPAAEEPSPGPFAALAVLKKAQDGSGE